MFPQFKEFTSAENGDEERHCSRRSARSAIWSSNSLSNLSLNSNIFFFQPNTCTSRSCCLNYDTGKDFLIQKSLFLTILQDTFKIHHLLSGLWVCWTYKRIISRRMFFGCLHHMPSNPSNWSQNYYFYIKEQMASTLYRIFKALWFPAKQVTCHLVWVIVTIVSRLRCNLTWRKILWLSIPWGSLTWEIPEVTLLRGLSWKKWGEWWPVTTCCPIATSESSREIWIYVNLEGRCWFWKKGKRWEDIK